jgi:tetratricopeptide (TPR) repeat protein
MGTIYSDLNNYLAIDYFNYASTIKPDRNDIFYKIGMFYQKMNNYDDAILNYSKSIELNPLDKFSYHNIGVISIYKDNFKDAIENFSYAIDIDPTYNEAYFGRAYSYELSNKKLESETDYRTSLMINPSYRPSILGLERLTK